MQTEAAELESGQSFVIGGLLDNSTTESLSKIPGLGYIPMLGMLAQSKTKSNTELLVIITPEIMRPIAAGRPGPSPPRYPPPPTRLPELDSPLPPSRPPALLCPFLGLRRVQSAGDEACFCFMLRSLTFVLPWGRGYGN